MKLKILSVGVKSPQWVQAGFTEYSRRMPRELEMQLIEIAPGKHHKDPAKFKAAEGAKMLDQVKPQDWVVKLDEQGRQLTSKQLAGRIARWRQMGKNVAFIIGGSDGLHETVSARADESVSLSRLTLPHYVVRVYLAEALYRAWTIIQGHPYHRE